MKYRQVVSESEHQIALFQWAKLNENKCPELALMFHIPNGGKRSIATAKRLKAEGVKAGVPDICLPVAKGQYHGLFIEMKNEKGRPTDNQKKWLSNLTEGGYKTAICHGWFEAVEVIKEYMTI